MKIRVTKKSIMENFDHIITLSYNQAQHLLEFEQAFAYSFGLSGWSCDYYEIKNVCICTGYSPIQGDSIIKGSSIVGKYDEQARKILDVKYDEQTGKMMVVLLLLAPCLTRSALCWLVVD